MRLPTTHKFLSRAMRADFSLSNDFASVAQSATDLADLLSRPDSAQLRQAVITEAVDTKNWPAPRERSARGT